jgi:hypothetical protein
MFLERILEVGSGYITSKVFSPFIPFDAVEGPDNELTGDLADVRPKASNLEPAGGLYSGLSEKRPKPASESKTSVVVVEP